MVQYSYPKSHHIRERERDTKHIYDLRASNKSSILFFFKSIVASMWDEVFKP